MDTLRHLHSAFRGRSHSPCLVVRGGHTQTSAFRLQRTKSLTTLGGARWTHSDICISPSEDEVTHHAWWCEVDTLRHLHSAFRGRSHSPRLVVRGGHTQTSAFRLQRTKSLTMLGDARWTHSDICIMPSED